MLPPSILIHEPAEVMPDVAAAVESDGKYVGYRLSKGKLSFDLKYEVSQKQLEA